VCRTRPYGRVRHKFSIPTAGREAALDSSVEEAARFLTWLDQRGTQLGECTQADIDIWHAQTLAHHKRLARPFLIWAKNTGRMAKLDIPTATAGATKPITQSRRLALLRRALTDSRPPLRSRVAAALMLLYGQPVARLVRLTIADVVADDDQVLIRLGTPPLPVPEPLAGMLLELVGNRQNMNTVNPASYWLFPGRRAGQPVHFSTLLGHLRHDLGLPAQATKSATLRQLVLQAPAPVVADALGFSAKHMTRIWGAAGGSWTTYATRERGRDSPR
jgi:integrase